MADFINNPLLDPSSINFNVAGGGLDPTAAPVPVSGGMSNLLQNKLFLQYLSGMGADIAAGKGIGPNVNAITQQNIQSQNMMKLLKQALGPDQTKLTADSTGLTFKTPTSSPTMSSFLSGGSNEGVAGTSPFATDPSLTPTVNPTQPTQSVNTGAVAPVGRINPFASSSPDISGADLAGLTPHDIASVMGIKHAQDTLNQSSYKEAMANLTDVPYKQALTKQALAAVAENTPSMDVTVPGGGTVKLTPKDYIAYRKIHEESQPAKVKEFAFAQSAAGGNFKGSFTDFMSAGDTVGMKDFAEAKRTGYAGKSFYDYKIAMAKAGAMNLGDKLTEKKAMSELGGQDYFNNPKWTEDVHKQVAEFDKSQAWQIAEAARPLAKSKVIVQAVENKIAAGSGTIQSVTMDKDNKTMVWTVKWPSGDTKTIRQAVR